MRSSSTRAHSVSKGSFYRAADASAAAARLEFIISNVVAEDFFEPLQKVCRINRRPVWIYDPERAVVVVVGQRQDTDTESSAEVRTRLVSRVGADAG